MFSRYTAGVDSQRMDMAALGRAIVRRRRARDWSSHRLSVNAKVADPYLAHLERGEGKRLGLDVLIRIAEALNTTVDELLREAGIPTSAGANSEDAVTIFGLDEHARHAALQMGQVLRELQERYNAEAISGESQEDDHLSDAERRLFERPAAVDRDIKPPEDVEPA